MKRLHVILLLLSALMLCAGGRSGSAQTAYSYPWCAEYVGQYENCGFVTFQQCEATIRGVGGWCIPSPYYRPAAARAKRRR